MFHVFIYFIKIFIPVVYILCLSVTYIIQVVMYNIKGPVCKIMAPGSDFLVLSHAVPPFKHVRKTINRYKGLIFR